MSILSTETRSPSAVEEHRLLMRAIKSRMVQPSESTELTEDEIALFDDEEALALGTHDASAELCEQMAKFANLGDPKETQAFLRDFASWIEQKKAERSATTLHSQEVNE